MEWRIDSGVCVCAVLNRNGFVLDARMHHKTVGRVYTELGHFRHFDNGISD